MGNALRKSPTVNVDAGDWTSAYNLASKTVQRQRTQTLLLLGKSSTDEATEHASVQKEGSKVAAVNDYHVVKTLGKGAFGEVFLTQRGGEKFAMKVLKKSALKKMRIGRGGSAFDSIKTEIATMKKIGHPNCVQMFDVILDDEQDEVFLVLEFVDGGPSQVKGSDGKYVLLPERTVWSHLRHLVMGLEYLHMNGIVHRDIKPDNLLVTRPGRMYQSDAGILKIADFGTSCFCEGDANAQKTAGTPPFFSPELCSADASGTYDSRVVDLWAVGVTLHLWLSGRLPFEAPTTMLLLQAISAAPDQVTPPSEVLAAGLQAIIAGLLTRDPATRLTLVQLRLHQWLTAADRAAARSERGQPLPLQPERQVTVSVEEIEQAVTNRATIKVGSASGPSALGAALSLCGKGESTGGWMRLGANTIRKRCNKAEANFYRAIAASGHLAPHLPIIYSISGADGGGGESDHLRMSSLAPSGTTEDGPSSRGSSFKGRLERAKTGSLLVGSVALTTARTSFSFKEFKAGGFSFGGSSPRENDGGASSAKEAALANRAKEAAPTASRPRSASADAIGSSPAADAPTVMSMASGGSASSADSEVAMATEADAEYIPGCAHTEHLAPSCGSSSVLPSAAASGAAVPFRVASAPPSSSAGSAKARPPSRGSVTFSPSTRQEDGAASDSDGGGHEAAPRVARKKTVPTAERVFEAREEGELVPPAVARTKTTATALASSDETEIHILMGDLVTGMTRPCAMSFLLGTRTVTPAEVAAEAVEPPHPALLAAMRELAPGAVGELSEEEQASNGVSLRRYLGFIDQLSSTGALGFRVDAAKTVVEGGHVDVLPLPDGQRIDTLADEDALIAALATFLQHDHRLAAATCLKLQTLDAALVRSSFFARHVFLRTTMLLVFDDAARSSSVDLKIMNFGSSYALPEGARVTHLAPWDGTTECHEDGYLTGVRSLLRLVEAVCKQLAPQVSADQVEVKEADGASAGGVHGKKALPPPPGRGLRR